MADKVQNITVNYKINTADLEKSRNLSQQAQQATDKFHQSAQQGATKSASDLSKLTNEQTKLENAIKSTSRSSFTSYAAYAKQIQNLSRQYSDVKIKIDSATKAINEQTKAQQQLNKETKTAVSSFSGLGTAISGYLTVATLKAAVNFTIEMAKLAGNVDGVTRAFDKLPNSLVVLDQLREATQGTVTDFELMQRALQAKNFRIPLQQLGDLFKFATVRAQQTGQSVDYLINSIVFGLGFQSIRRLDNVGISAAELRDVMKELGVSLNEAFNIVVQREIVKMGGLIKNTATDAQILEASIEKVRQVFAAKISSSEGLGVLSTAMKSLATDIKAFPTDKLGEIFTLGVVNPVGILNFLREWSHSIDQVRIDEDNLRRASVELQEVQKNLGVTQIQQADNILKEISFRKERIRTLNEEQDKFKAQLALNDLELKGNSARRVEFLKRRDELNSSIEGIGRRLAIDTVVASELRKILLDLTKGTSVELGLIEAKLAEIEDVADGIKTAKSQKEIHDLSNELARLKGELADLEAFGTTKQFLQVNGVLKLVPVVAPKNATVTAATQASEMTDQLQKEIQDQISGLRFTIPLMAGPSTGITPMTEWEQIGQAFADNWKGILNQGLDDTTNFLGAVIDSEAEAYEARIAQSRSYYDRLMILAGDNEKAKDRLRLREQKEENKLRREAFEAEKKAQISKAAINGAAAIVKTYAELGYPAGIPAVLLLIASTAAQIATIQQQKPRFAKGVINLQGPGTKTSDSIDAKLSKGESVMTADETRNSMGILKAVRAKTLDDKVLKDLKLTSTGVFYGGGMDDKRIVEKLDEVKNSIPDYAVIHGMMHKTKKKSENYKLWVRTKSF